MITVSKWNPKVTGQPVRYYLNGLNTIPSDAKVWVQANRSGKLEVKSNGVHFPDIGQLLDQLLVYSLIAPQDIKNPTIGIFELLSEKRGKQAKQSFPTSSTRTGEANDTVLLVNPIALEQPVTIQIDHREPPEIFAAFAAIQGVVIEKTVLTVGDIVFDGGIVERKSASDFNQSIIDKRLFFQSDDISALDAQTLKAVILEGNIYSAGRLTTNALDGAVSYLAVLQGISVLNSTSPQHTANLVARMASHSSHGLPYEISYRPAKPKSIEDQLLYVIQGVPGVGVETGKALLHHFGCLSKIFQATVDQIQSVNGIGNKTAQKIYSVFHQEWLN